MKYLINYNENLNENTDWKETKSGLYKKYEFSDFKQAINFINSCAEIINKENHHPKLTNEYNIVKVWLLTHDVGGKITEKDYNLAKLFDGILNTEISTKLTKREKLILNLLKSGKSYQGIADELGISFYTANFHIKNLYKKFGVNSNIALLAKKII